MARRNSASWAIRDGSAKSSAVAQNTVTILTTVENFPGAGCASIANAIVAGRRAD
jgi:hypothetical protein